MPVEKKKELLQNPTVTRSGLNPPPCLALVEGSNEVILVNGALNMCPLKLPMAMSISQFRFRTFTFVLGTDFFTSIHSPPSKVIGVYHIFGKKGREVRPHLWEQRCPNDFCIGCDSDISCRSGNS